VNIGMSNLPLLQQFWNVLWNTVLPTNCASMFHYESSERIKVKKEKQLSKLRFCKF
jgi:hypothetical protein